MFAADASSSATSPSKRRAVADAAAAAAAQRRFRNLPQTVAWIHTNDLEDGQRTGLMAMVEKFAGSYSFTQEISRSTLVRLRRDASYGWTDPKIRGLFRRSGWMSSEQLERGRSGNLGAPLDGVTDEEDWALNKAFYTELLGFPLLVWDRRIGLKPSPLRRICQCLALLLPRHQLKKIKVKQLYDEAKRQLGCSDMYRDADYDQRKKWNQEMVRAVSDRIKTLDGKVSQELRTANAWLDGKGGSGYGHGGHGGHGDHHHHRRSSAGGRLEGNGDDDDDDDDNDDGNDDNAPEGVEAGAVGADANNPLQHADETLDDRMERLLFADRNEKEMEQKMKDREDKNKLEKRLQSLTENNIIRSVENADTRYTSVDNPVSGVSGWVSESG